MKKRQKDTFLCCKIAYELKAPLMLNTTDVII